jgi:hypothetical protein
MMIISFLNGGSKKSYFNGKESVFKKIFGRKRKLTYDDIFSLSCCRLQQEMQHIGSKYLFQIER